MPEVTCPNCGTRLSAPEAFLGRQVTCGQCKQGFTISPPGPPTPPPPPGPGPLPPPLSSPLSSHSQTSGLATASLVLGIISIPGSFCYALPGLICGILAIIFGVLARKAVARGTAGGSSLSLAKAGLICGVIGIILAVLFVIVVAGIVAWAQSQATARPYRVRTF
ncbi:MAG TPA: DUF4190 domain-containing protein [Phycisphaerae bacterium]|nr:DUF4190 domain-containing protein [Phycisphaerae bacterium]